LIQRVVRLEPAETKNDEGRTIPIMSWLVDPRGKPTRLISGHKTRSMLDRYNIVSEGGLFEAADKVRRYLESPQLPSDKDNLRRQTKETTSGFWDETATLLKTWCGEGDLNPHEITPASTSS
jgi:hypothetical protein